MQTHRVSYPQDTYILSILILKVVPCGIRHIHLSNWTESLMSASGQAELLSIFHWIDQIATALLTCGQLQVSVQCHMSKSRAGFLLHLHLLLCAPPPWLILEFFPLADSSSSSLLHFAEENLLCWNWNIRTYKFCFDQVVPLWKSVIRLSPTVLVESIKYCYDPLPCQPVNGNLLIKDRSWNY